MRANAGGKAREPLAERLAHRRGERDGSGQRAACDREYAVCAESPDLLGQDLFPGPPEGDAIHAGIAVDAGLDHGSSLRFAALAAADPAVAGGKWSRADRAAARHYDHKCSI